jgi:outer membrane protein assembly factor BamB
VQPSKRTITALLTLAASCLLAAATPVAVPAMFRGDARHLGLYDSAAPKLNAVLWRFHAKARIISSPAISNGSVFFGSDDGNIYAVRSSDGARLWSFRTKGPVRSSPAVAGGLVFAASLDGFIYAIDETTGTLRWQFKTLGESRFTAPGIHGIQPSTETMPDPYDLLTSSPAVADGIVYIGSGRRPAMEV